MLQNRFETVTLTRGHSVGAYTGTWREVNRTVQMMNDRQCTTIWMLRWAFLYSWCYAFCHWYPAHFTPRPFHRHCTWYFASFLPPRLAELPKQVPPVMLTLERFAEMPPVGVQTKPGVFGFRRFYDSRWPPERTPVAFNHKETWYLNEMDLH